MVLNNANDLRKEIGIILMDTYHPEGAAAPLTEDIIRHFLDAGDANLLKECVEVIKEELSCPICRLVCYYSVISTCCFQAFCFGCRGLWNLDNSNKICPGCHSTDGKYKSVRKSKEIEAILDVIMERNHPGYLEERDAMLTIQRKLYFQKRKPQILISPSL